MICSYFLKFISFFDCISADKWSAIGTVVGGLGACFAGFIAWIQLKGLNDSLKTANVTAVLQVEAELNVRKKDLDSSMLKIIEMDKKSKKYGKKSKFLEIEIKEYKTLLENYLNILDRLSNLILRGHLNNVVDWKDDYEEQIRKLVKAHKTELGKDTPYKNIIKLNQKWLRK